MLAPARPARALAARRRGRPRPSNPGSFQLCPVSLSVASLLHAHCFLLLMHPLHRRSLVLTRILGDSPRSSTPAVARLVAARSPQPAPVPPWPARTTPTTRLPPAPCPGFSLASRPQLAGSRPAPVRRERADSDAVDPGSRVFVRSGAPCGAEGFRARLCGKQRKNVAAWLAPRTAESAQMRSATRQYDGGESKELAPSAPSGQAVLRLEHSSGRLHGHRMRVGMRVPVRMGMRGPSVSVLIKQTLPTAFVGPCSCRRFTFLVRSCASPTARPHSVLDMRSTRVGRKDKETLQCKQSGCLAQA